jgi:Mg2+ and Co2+ transporter CorA
MVAMVIDTLGVRLAATAADMRGHVQGGRFFWLDVFGDDEATRTELLQEMGLDSPEIAWALRFGQSGRMYISRNKLRVVTWMADPAGDVHEVHVFSGPNGIMTIWHGDATALSEIRQQFGERVAGLENSPYGAAGILLQLLAGTLDHTLHGLDLALDELRARLNKDPSAAEFALVSKRLRKLQSIMSSFNRFSSAVRSAIVGIEAGRAWTPAAQRNSTSTPNSWKTSSTKSMNAAAGYPTPCTTARPQSRSARVNKSVD